MTKLDLSAIEGRLEIAKPAIENLTTCQRQLDMDGCEVGVSRQALDETLAVAADISSLIAAVRERDERIAAMEAALRAAADDLMACAIDFSLSGDTVYGQSVTNMAARARAALASGGA